MDLLSKTLKKKFAAVIIAAVVLLTGIFTVGGISGKKTAYAESPETPVTQKTIYYFTDYYPTLSYNVLGYEYGHYHIVYDRQSVTAGEFTDMVFNGYFFGFDAGTVVIIDIKTFMPDPNILFFLFSELQQNEGCITAFLTVYDEKEYYDTEFSYYVNKFIDNVKLTSLEEFVKTSLTDLYDNRNGTVDYTTYLLDGSLVNVYMYDISIEEICMTSPFLRYFLEQLATYLDISYTSYDEIAEILRTKYHIKLLVQTGDNEFVDILTWFPYYYSDLNGLMHDYDDTYFACALGFWKFNYNLYDILCNIQNNEGYKIPVYVFEIDPIAYGPDGLEIILTGSSGYDDAARELLGALRELLG